MLALPAVGGKFGVRGGGYAMSNSAAWGINAAVARRAGAPDARDQHESARRVLTEPPRPPVSLLFVYNCNPAATIPDQERVLRGLERDDLFTVVFEQVLTDTVRTRTSSCRRRRSWSTTISRERTVRSRCS